MINRIVETLRKDGAVTFDPADDRAVRFAGAMLTSHRFATVPNHYITLLKQTDGLVWNGIEFYGTRANERKEQGYIMPGLIEANMGFVGHEAFRGRLILGRAAEEMFIFDGRERKYQILDRLDFSVNASFSSFPEVVYLFVDELF